MKITKYRQAKEPRHIVEYQDAPGHVRVGKFGTDEEPPTSFVQAMRDLRSECASVYGQEGIVISEIRWSYDDKGDEVSVLISGSVPHWSGDIKASLPKFAIRMEVTYDEVQERIVTVRRYPKSLETIGEATDQIRDALTEFVRLRTSQMELGFGTLDGADGAAITVAGMTPTLSRSGD